MSLLLGDERTDVRGTYDLVNEAIAELIKAKRKLVMAAMKSRSTMTGMNDSRNRVTMATNSEEIAEVRDSVEENIRLLGSSKDSMRTMLHN